MTKLRGILSVLLMLLGLAALLYAAWIGLNSNLPGSEISFTDADAIHTSVYKDASIDKLLEQNLRMQEAIFQAQKQGFISTIENLKSVQMASNQMYIRVFLLIGFAVFFMTAAILIYPTKLKVHNHTLAQIERILWESWVVEKPAENGNEFEVRKAAYPVNLCGCSDSGVPVSLCGCNANALPVHLCGCNGGYLDNCDHNLPVHLCLCGCHDK